MAGVEGGTGLTEITREMILAMEANPEMDALVAERVMGLPSIALKDAGCPYCDDVMRFCGERSWCSSCHEWRYSPYQEYSDDIAAAWEVVEKYTDVEFEKAGGNYRVWLIDLGIASATTFPLAVCRAALLATLDIKEATDGPAN